MEPEPRTSSIERIGLAILVTMLAVGMLAVALPESVLRAVVASLLG